VKNFETKEQKEEEEYLKLERYCIKNENELEYPKNNNTIGEIKYNDFLKIAQVKKG
jgi:hypothetical protein